MSRFPHFRYVNRLSLRNKLGRLLWGFVWFVFFRPTPRWALNGWRLFLLQMFGAQIGEGSRVLPSCRIWAPWNLKMGRYSVLGDDVDCYTMAKITIGDHVSISQRAFLCTGSHDISSIALPLTTNPIEIADYVWVCADAFVGPGCRIGTGSVVAARAVCVRQVAEWVVVAGNPAQVVGVRQVSEAGGQ